MTQKDPSTERPAEAGVPETKSRKENGFTNLGDFVGLESAPPREELEENVSSRTSPSTSNENQSDPSSLASSDQPEEQREHNDNGASDQFYTENPSEEPAAPVFTAAEPALTYRPTGNGPVLWMMEPERYSWVLESFRNVKSKVIALREKNDQQVFLVTGPERMVGVSAITFNLSLALSWDLIDRRILLVDANISNPSLHDSFGCASSPGLIDHLINGLPLASVTQKSPLPNMDLISIGSTDRRLISPFDLKRFSFFLEEVRKQYDFVLMDSAPALRSSHTRIVSSKVDGVLIVAEANRTRWEVVDQLRMQLQNDGANLVGGFLNKRRFVIPRWLYRFS